jgi:hypothetical protein
MKVRVTVAVHCMRERPANQSGRANDRPRLSPTTPRRHAVAFHIGDGTRYGFVVGGQHLVGHIPPAQGEQHTG